jgi:hypothetical protein
MNTPIQLYPFGFLMSIIKILLGAEKKGTGENGIVTQTSACVIQSPGNVTLTLDNGTNPSVNGTLTSDNGTKAEDNGALTSDNGTKAEDNGALASDNGTKAEDNETKSSVKITLTHVHVTQAHDTATYPDAGETKPKTIKGTGEFLMDS